MEQRQVIEGIDVHIEGEGAHTIVMIHGWPDTYRLWDHQLERFKSRYRCVRFSLPGYEHRQPRQYYDLNTMLMLFDSIIDRISEGKPVTLLLHDWGCVFGYQYAMRNPEKVERIIGVDIGDASSKDLQLSAKAKVVLLGYQLWLMLAWNLGGKLGDWMTRKMAHVFGAPGEASRIHSGMNYPYHWRWSSAFMRRELGTIPLDIQVPFLFIYGREKVGMFHSKSWQRKMANIEGNKVVGLSTHHWVMAEQPETFNRIVEQWLAESDALLAPLDLQTSA
ncbi:alpha/beta fold hydrolase [Vibrio sp. McD22-P3]|uniref:alpha/beta fold hydrolase n=1 Tax=Vibrio sp. McD22-P3 TaxID=2724880 RepID=UPI001F20E10E|nr:alpha/beta hydrolase [Vibrio sp. McD22-P3]MCF4172144.1 alpha/beta hydrolase [Vibrio sp. McD22-P3]